MKTIIIEVSVNDDWYTDVLIFFKTLRMFMIAKLDSMIVREHGQ